MPQTPPAPAGKTAKPRRPRAKKTVTSGEDVRLTGDRLVVQLPGNGERTSASGLLIPATAAPAPKRLAWADVRLVGPDVRVAARATRVWFSPPPAPGWRRTDKSPASLLSGTSKASRPPPRRDPPPRRAPGPFR